MDLTCIASIQPQSDVVVLFHSDIGSDIGMLYTIGIKEFTYYILSDLATNYTVL